MEMTCRYIKVKLIKPNIKKKKPLKLLEKKKTITRNATDIIIKTSKCNTVCNDNFKVLKEKTAKLVLYTQEKYFSKSRTKF